MIPTSNGSYQVEKKRKYGLYAGIFEGTAGPCQMANTRERHKKGGVGWDCESGRPAISVSKGQRKSLVVGIDFHPLLWLPHLPFQHWPCCKTTDGPKRHYLT